jgi:hypothetical protein
MKIFISLKHDFDIGNQVLNIKNVIRTRNSRRVNENEGVLVKLVVPNPEGEHREFFRRKLN